MMMNLNMASLFFFGANRPLSTLPFQSVKQDSTDNVPLSKEDSPSLLPHLELTWSVKVAYSREVQLKKQSPYQTDCHRSHCHCRYRAGKGLGPQPGKLFSLKFIDFETRFGEN